MYKAFISYSHAADGKLAPAIQSALERFAKPWYKVRYFSVFRDEASLSASPHLWSNIQSALEKSEYLIYLASPTSASSKWVKKEILYWLENKSINNLLIVLTEGEIAWDDQNKIFLNAEINSLPDELEKVFTEEPFYVDLRYVRTETDLSLQNPIFKKEILKLAAPLHGKEPKDLASEEVSAHNRMIRIRNVAIGSLIVLLVAAIAGGYIANENRKEANKNAERATVNQLKADSAAITASQQRDSAIAARRLADYNALLARLQKDTAQFERDNAIKQEQIAIEEKNNALANYLVSQAKSQLEGDPTLALRLAEGALQASYDPLFEEFAYKIYRENSFYKIIDTLKDPYNQKVAFSSDGKSILMYSGDSVRIMNLRNKAIRLFIMPGGDDSTYLSHVDLSPDGKFIVFTRETRHSSNRKSSRGLELYDFSLAMQLYTLNGKLVQDYKIDSNFCDAVKFSRDGNSFISYSRKGVIKFWDLKGNLLRELRLPAKGNVYSAVISPDGKLIATVTSSSFERYENYGIAQLWSMEGQLMLEFKEFPKLTKSIEFSPDGKSILAGSFDNTVLLWGLIGNDQQVFKGHSETIRSVAFSPDGKSILTSSWDHTVRLWSLKEGIIRYFNGHYNSVNSVAFSPDGKTFLTGSSDNTARLWDLNGNMIQLLKFPFNDVINSVAFSPDGKTFLTGIGNFYDKDDYTAILWNLKGDTLQLFNGHTNIVTSVAFSPNGKTILTGSGDNTARLWDLHGHTLLKFKGHSREINSVAFSPDGKTILTGSGDNTARLWDLKGNTLQKFKGHEGTIFSVAFSPDGKKILTGSYDKTARMWDLRGNTLQEFRGQSSSINSVAFSPDGKTIITGADNRTNAWDLKGNTVKEFKSPVYGVQAVAFSPDGKSFLNGFSYGAVQLWYAAISLNDFLKSDRIEQLSAEQKKQYGIK